MNDAFLKGFVKAAHDAGLTEQQTTGLLYKLAMGAMGPNQLPPLSASNQMAQQMPVPGQMPGQMPGIPPAGGAPMQPTMQGQPNANMDMSLASVMRPKQLDQRAMSAQAI